MNVIDQITVQRRSGGESAATIELLEGDLSAMPPEHAVDALVVSAFPNSYKPYPATLFEHLFRRGLDMQIVAQNKEEDERERLGCWISRPLPIELAQQFNFSRIVCFEPRYAGFVANTRFDSRRIEDTVGYVFRCLNNFVIPEASEGHNARRFNITRVAMPLLATGNQSAPIESLLPRLLDAAVFWLEEGLPIKCLKIVAFAPAEAQLAARIFSTRTSSGPTTRDAKLAARLRQNTGSEADFTSTVGLQVLEMCTDHLRQQLLTLASHNERPIVQTLFDRLTSVRAPLAHGRLPGNDVAISSYDVFISYAHKQEQEVLAFVRELGRSYPNLSVFYDHSSISAGAQWLKMISEALRKTRLFVAVLSPEYSASPVCWDEFQCAKLREYNTGGSIIRTVRLYSERDLPPIMGIYSYVDCAEGDLEKLRECAATLLASIH
jgi:hypothetical protein